MYTYQCLICKQLLTSNKKIITNSQNNTNHMSHIERIAREKTK